jgi:hypothetical protein
MVGIRLVDTINGSSKIYVHKESDSVCENDEAMVCNDLDFNQSVCSLRTLKPLILQTENLKLLTETLKLLTENLVNTGNQKISRIFQ